LLGSPTVTNDLDICHARDPANLERLAAALLELGARLRGLDEEVPFVPDARTLQSGDRFTLATIAGSLDIVGTAAGITGTEELERTAVDMDLDGLKVRVATIDDLIRMKRAASRPKDLIEAEVLGALREELDVRRRPDGSG
jgi:hypothetical protein